MFDDHFHILSPCVLCPCRVAVRHVKVKPRCAVLTMLKRLDKIRFRGPRTRDDFPDLAESPPASDNECSDDMQLKPRTALRDTEDLLRDPVSNLFHLFFLLCLGLCPSLFSSFFLFLLNLFDLPLYISVFTFIICIILSKWLSCFCLIYCILIWSRLAS